LRKPPEEVLLTEIYPVVSEIRHVIKNLKKWTSLRKSEHPYHFLGQKAITDLRQKGGADYFTVELSFELSIGPLITAIAAGNAVVLKPSE